MTMRSRSLISWEKQLKNSGSQILTYTGITRWIYKTQMVGSHPIVSSPLVLARGPRLVFATNSQEMPMLPIGGTQF